jgi:beta-phosphoglucomutase-like phosphatase (HAD superfamily)
LRIGFDMDGVLADFSGAFEAVERRLFPADVHLSAGQPESEIERRDGEARDPAARRAESPHEARRRRDAIWADIRATPDFWMSLDPLVEGAVARIHEMMLRHRWEVFFITQRPATKGDTVQRQTQRWLVQQGFDLPSVLVIAGSRGAAAAALRLAYHVDDSPQNCLDVMSTGGAKPVLVSGSADQMVTTARNLGIALAPSVKQALDLLDQVSLAQSNPTLLKRLAALVGWK